MTFFLVGIGACIAALLVLGVLFWIAPLMEQIEAPQIDEDGERRARLAETSRWDERTREQRRRGVR